MRSLVTILGPTSTGKTSLALRLCQKFNGEIISADSRQVYKYADLGTNKISSTELKTITIEKHTGWWRQDGVRINLYDVVEPDQFYSAGHFLEDALGVIQDIWARGKLPFLVGGTGFYISAFLGDVRLSAVPASPRLRKKLGGLSLEELQVQLRQLDPARWEKMNRAERLNAQRLVRALEVAIERRRLGKSKEQGRVHLPAEVRVLRIGLKTSREQMYARADRWAHRLVMSDDLIDETRDLLARGYRESRLLRGIIYRPAVAWIEGEILDRLELVKIIQGQLHAYIRRQMAWFKRDPQVKWFDISRTDYQTRVERLLKEWYSDE